MREIDYDKLKNDLINYFGTAAQESFPAYMDLIKVKSASNEQLENIAVINNFNLNDYEKGYERKLYNFTKTK